MAQAGTTLLLLVAVLGAGFPIARAASRTLRLPTATRVALVLAAGLAFVGVVTLVVGHLHALGPWLPFALAGAGILLGLTGLGSSRVLIVDAWRGLRRQFRAYPVPLIAVSAALLVAAVLTFQPPWRIDEVEYHWAAPVAWVDTGGWNDSPYRHVDGFPFMEVLYTAAATQGSYAAAHMLHFSSFLMLGFAVAGIAASLGVKGTGVTAAAALAMPVVWDSSYVGYNDTPVAAFAAVAVATVLASDAARLTPAWLAGGLLAVAVSIKPIGVASVGLLGLMILLRWVFARAAARRGEGPPAPAFSRILLQWVALAVPTAAMLLFWNVRQLVITGFWLGEPTGAPSADALSRLPDLTDRLVAPFLPFVSGVIGSAEPWGGRTAVVIQVLLIPAIVYLIWRRGDALRRFTLALVPAWSSWIVLGLEGVRTRFHVISWALMVVSVRVALEDAQTRFPRLRVWLELLWTLCILAGLADVSLEMFRALTSRWGGQ